MKFINSKFLPIFFSSLIAGFFVAISILAWNNPTATPPNGDSALYYASSTGNFGIGTTAPGSMLHIYNSIPKIIVQDNDNAMTETNATAYVTFWDKNGAQMGYVGDGGDGQNITLNGETDYSLTFSAGGVNRMFIASSTGNVGIGTTGPNSKLEVAGTIHSTTGGIKFPDGTTQTTSAGVVSSRKICLENEYCSGTPKICAYFRNTSGVVSADDYSVSFGSWSNPQCGLSGSGWHVDNIDSCSIDSGLKQLSCAFVIVE